MNQNSNHSDDINSENISENEEKNNDVANQEKTPEHKSLGN